MSPSTSPTTDAAQAIFFSQTHDVLRDESAVNIVRFNLLLGSRRNDGVKPPQRVAEAHPQREDRVATFAAQVTVSTNGVGEFVSATR